MAVFYHPGIVTNGLIFCLDAGNTRSYPGSGTTWTDLRGRVNTGTLTNGPTYSSANGGSIVFDGVNDYTDCSNPSFLQITVGTISAWFNATNANSGYCPILMKENAWSLYVAGNILLTYDWGGGGNRSTGITVGNSTWNYAAMTFTETVGTPSNNAIIYLNGSAVLTTTVKNVSQLLPVEIGGTPRNSGQWLNGRVAQASIYNRVLTASEVQQNFNATRGRFGI
jgi:hypothetical protein